MSECASPTAASQSGARKGVRHRRSRKKDPDPAGREVRRALAGLVVLPAAGILLLATAAIVVAPAVSRAGAGYVVTAAVAIGVGVLWPAYRGALTVARSVEEDSRLVAEWVTYLLGQVRAGTDEARAATVRLRRGQRPLVACEDVAVEGDHPFAQLARDLHGYRKEVGEALVQAEGQRVRVFVNFSHRLRGLVQAAQAKLDDVERDVEDPDHLARLYGVDHDVTRISRAAESMAVMGGARLPSHEDPSSVRGILRLGIQEIDQYRRAKVIAAPDAHLPGYAVAAVAHLLAELLENATEFSRPATQVDVRASLIPLGLLVEIDDKGGLSMDREMLARMNDLLTDPEESDTSAELLRQGRNGLYVVASLAHRYGITVELRENLYGGIQAVVILPQALLEAGRLEVAEQQEARRAALSEPMPMAHTAPPERPARSRAAARAPMAHGRASTPPVAPAELYLVGGGAAGDTGSLPQLPVRPDVDFSGPDENSREQAPLGSTSQSGALPTEHSWQLAANFTSGWDAAAENNDGGPK
ncbi:hypothetical protein OIB37_11420 [Streptomyces sp. NBC_00820]|uniref:ATP-binding protein n=1 Tax=Streptomyces sp. NBC_00820 TaxID=2975842 RepID=UPI002ED44B8A|nr:hypothetical protein OIB37_11420 [Streptomyces sp. NBC_00820]